MSQEYGFPEPIGLTIEVTDAGRCRVLALTGEIDAASVGDLLRESDDLAAAGHVDQVLDLGGVRFLDSSGLGAFVSLRRQLAVAGGSLALACDNESIMRLLRLTSLDTVLPVHPSVAEALGDGLGG